MLNINPLLLVGGVIGAVTALLIFAYASVKDKKTAMGFERTMADGEILRRLAGYAKPYWAKFVVVLFLMLFSIAYDIISPLIVGAIEELVAADFTLSRLFASVAVYAGVLVFSMASTYFQAVILQRVGQRIISDLREDLFTHIESLSHEQLNEIPVGKLVTRVTNDTNAISMMFTNLLVNLTKNAFVILGILVAMLCLNYALTLMVLCFVPFIVIFTVIFRKFSRRAYRKVKDATTDINTYLSENLSGIKVTQIFGREDEKMAEFYQKSQTLSKVTQEQIFVFGVFRPLVYMLYISSILCLFYLGGMGHLNNVSFLGQTITGGTIVTFYMFYEAMTLLTMPLVMHSGSKEAVAAGIKYMIYSVVGASLVLLGIFAIAPYAQSLSFAPGGALDMAKVAGHEGFVLAIGGVMLLGFGAKAGLYPLHGWLPTAPPAAPSPASAVLSGVITKAGVLGLLRVIYCFLGAQNLRGTWVQTVLMALSLLTVFIGSLLAYREHHLKKRLAWSTVSQVSYVVFGLSTLHPLGLLGAMLHVVCHSLVKDVLFMGAGAVILKTGETQVDALRGIGKRMPVTMWCFAIGSLGLIGIPPCLGFFSKWELAQGSLAMTGVASWLNWFGPVVLLLSALLTAGYLMPIVLRGFFPGKDVQVGEKCEASASMLIPMLVLTVLSVALGMFPSLLTDLLSPILTALL